MEEAENGPVHVQMCQGMEEAENGPVHVQGCPTGHSRCFQSLRAVGGEVAGPSASDLIQRLDLHRGEPAPAVLRVCVLLVHLGQVAAVTAC